MNSIVVVDDKENILKVLKVILTKQGYDVRIFNSARTALKQVILQRPDLIISDIKMADMSGRELFELLCSRGFQIPFIFMTAFGTIDDAVSLIKRGAVDYMTKPLDYQELNRKISRILQSSGRDVQRSLSSGKELIGSSEAMQQVYERIRNIADTSSTVLLEGESGTGKELAARAIHRSSSRKGRPFIAVNCSAYNENLLESELFGHEKGSFTNALRQRSGVFEEAEGGTLFIDEVSEISPAIQLKLLRVLQEKVFLRVGGNELLRADVRIIAATNRPLKGLVEEGVFRHDLYYRLHVIPFRLPPLRDHLEDLPELLEHFIQLICQREQLIVPSTSSSFTTILKQHSWPGNIRELENVIERILILHRPERLDAALLLQEPEFIDLREPDDERLTIISALQSSRGNKSEACRILGISRRNLYYKLERYHIQPFEYLIS